MEERIPIAVVSFTYLGQRYKNVKVFENNVLVAEDGSQLRLPDHLYKDVLDKSKKANRIENKERQEPKPEPDNIFVEQIQVKYMDSETGVITDSIPEVKEAGQLKPEDLKKDNNPDEDKGLWFEQLIARANGREINQKTEESIPETKENDETQQEEDSGEESSQEKEEKPKGKKGYLFVSLAFLVMFLITGIMYMKTGMPSVPSGSASESGSRITGLEDYVYCVVTVNDIREGQKIEEQDISVVLVSKQKTEQAESTKYISENGDVRSAVHLSDAGEAAGYFAVSDIPAGSILTDRMITNLSVIKEKTYIDVEIDGETLTVESSSLSSLTDTSIKIVALITNTDTNETVAVSLAEFVVENRTLADIFDSAGVNIMDKLAQETAQDTNGETE